MSSVLDDVGTYLTGPGHVYYIAFPDYMAGVSDRERPWIRAYNKVVNSARRIGNAGLAERLVAPGLAFVHNVTNAAGTLAPDIRLSDDGSTANTGHAGVLLIGKGGRAKYFEFGRYRHDADGVISVPAADGSPGNIRSLSVPDWEDGDTDETYIKKLADALPYSKQKMVLSGTEASDLSAPFKYIMELAGSDKRAGYSIKPPFNTCSTFAREVFDKSRGMDTVLGKTLDVVGGFGPMRDSPELYISGPRMIYKDGNVTRDAVDKQDAKGGRAVRAALEGGESAGEPSAAAPQASEASKAPAESYSGPRIAVNPEVFSDDRDALCVALNEAFRVIMEINGFDPVAEPTDAQRRFFADTAYANDETQLRRTILARICTFDTSIGKPAGGEHTGHKESTEPTQEQLEEAVEFLHTVLEIGAPQNKWEQNVVKRILTVLEKAVEVGRSMPTEKEAPIEESPTEKKAPVSSPEEVQGDFYGGAVSKEEEDEFKRLDAEADRQIAEEKEVKQFLEERGMEYGPGTTTMEDAIAKHTEMVSGSAPADNPAVAGFGSAEDVTKQRSEMEKWAADRDANLEKKAESELGAKVFAGTATDEEKAQWNNVAQQAAAQPFGGAEQQAPATGEQGQPRYVRNKAGVMVLNRGAGQTRQAADFQGSTFDRATGNWSFSDGTRMTSADKKAMNDIFNRGGRFDSLSIMNGMKDFDWS